MKLAVINYTGTVGKTTLATNLLAARIKDAFFVAVESVNESAADLGHDVEKLRGDMFRTIFNKLMLVDNAILDIGSSNIEDFMTNLQDFDGAQLEIDYFIVPVTSGTKEQKETMKMIAILSAMGVPADRIRIVFNRVKRSVAEEFTILTAYHESTASFWMNSECAVLETELFDVLSLKKLTMQSLTEDDTDYKTLLRNKEASAQERDAWSEMYGLKLLCTTVNRRLDNVFNILLDQE